MDAFDVDAAIARAKARLDAPKLKPPEASADGFAELAYAIARTSESWTRLYGDYLLAVMREVLREQADWYERRAARG